MTVAENIALIPEMKGLGKEETLTRTRELLTKVGLEPDSYLDRLPKDLSGGENSGSGFCGIIANPKVLLMDEPFSALDPISKAQLQDLIKELHEEFKMTTVSLPMIWMRRLNWRIASVSCKMDKLCN